MMKVKHEERGDWKVENVGGMKLGKRENPEKTSKFPTLSTTIALPLGDTETRTLDPSRDRREV